jgi:sugar phosphate isomerase/epimerase
VLTLRGFTRSIDALIHTMKHLLERTRHPLAFMACLLIASPVPRIDASLVVYDFNLGMTPARNCDYVESIGFSGLVTSVETLADLTTLQDYTQHVLTLNGFDLFAYVSFNFNDPNSPAVWRGALPILAQTGAPLWVIVTSSPSITATRDLLRDMARWTSFYGIEAVIYPHWDTSIETAADASALITMVGHPNLKSSLHTCHEIRGGNQYTLPAVAAAYAGETALVTIAGADDNAYSGPPPYPWDDAIKPLSEGSFDLLPFLQALNNAGYDGPVILHTFGITSPPWHRQESRAVYAELSANL